LHVLTREKGEIEKKCCYYLWPKIYLHKVESLIFWGTTYIRHWLFWVLLLIVACLCSLVEGGWKGWCITEVLPWVCFGQTDFRDFRVSRYGFQIVHTIKVVPLQRTGKFTIRNEKKMMSSRVDKRWRDLHTGAPPFLPHSASCFLFHPLCYLFAISV
jgi:hypothetical protein